MYLNSNKYNNKKIIVDEIKFDSKREAERYKELKLLEKTGEIKHLILQPEYELQPSYKLNNKTIRAIKYIADFTYIDKNGKQVIEDVKGYKTEIYKLKKKMFEYIYKTKIKEI